MSALNKISMAIAGLFGFGVPATPLSNRNGFVDGAFEYSIGAATTLTSTSAYTQAAMWQANCGTGGAGTATVTSIRTSAGAPTFTDSNPNNVLAIAMTTASTGNLAARTLPCVFQKVEWVNKYAGRSVTLSFKLWASIAVTIPGVFAQQVFGTGGSPSSPVTLDKPAAWNVGASSKKFSIRLDVPAISSATLGTNGNDYIALGIWLPAGWTGTLYIAEPQVEACNPNASSDATGAGGLATSFEYRGYGPELARVQRYYQAFTAGFVGNAYAASVFVGNHLGLSVPMRGTPAITQGSMSPVNCGTPTVSAVSLQIIQIYASSTAAGSAYASGSIALDARL